MHSGEFFEFLLHHEDGFSLLFTDLGFVFLKTKPRFTNLGFLFRFSKKQNILFVFYFVVFFGVLVFGLVRVGFCFWVGEGSARFFWLRPSRFEGES